MALARTYVPTSICSAAHVCCACCAPMNECLFYFGGERLCVVTTWPMRTGSTQLADRVHASPRRPSLTKESVRPTPYPISRRQALRCGLNGRQERVSGTLDPRHDVPLCAMRRSAQGSPRLEVLELFAGPGLPLCLLPGSQLRLLLFFRKLPDVGLALAEQPW